MKDETTEPDPPQTIPALAAEALDDLAAHLQRDPAALAEFIARLSPGDERKDGWTPFARKLFLQVVAETGKVALACEYAGLTRQSAYALYARDPLFAAGWDAAALIARNPLADTLYEQAADGITETVTRNGEVVATRHRFDSRLSIAVLHRLDKRCDRAEERGTAHLAVMRNWDQWLSLVGQGDEAGAQALLDSAQHCQTCQLPESANPTEAPYLPGYDPSDNVWKTDEGIWMTTFPPPPGFDGHENRPWDGFNWYERACTPDEAELLDTHQAAALAQEDAEIAAHAEAERDSWFAKLRLQR